MVSLEVVQATSKSMEPLSSPRISFSTDDNNFISISPREKDLEKLRQKGKPSEFEFLSSNNSGTKGTMSSADELFFEGKLLPFWQAQQSEKLKRISLKNSDQIEEEEEEKGKGSKKDNNESRTSWFLDDDPSPRPPKCTVLWKELLRLKKQRRPSLSPSSSSSSTSSSSSSLADAAKKEDGKKVKRAKKGLERTRSASIRIRPMVNVPICTQLKTTHALPPLFPLKKGKIRDMKI